MANVQIASVFTAIGFKVQKKDLDKLQKQLGNLKKQLIAIKKAANIDVKIANNSALANTRNQLQGINSQLVKIKDKTVNIRVNQTGTGLRGGGGASRKGAFLGGAVGSQIGQFAPGAGAVGAAGFGGLSVLKAGQDLEAMKAGFIAAAGGIEEGKEAFDFMLELSNTIGITFQDNARAYQNFLASARAVNLSAEKTRKVFAATAASARVLGLSAADTNGVMRAMTQMLSKGNIQAEELRGQLGERLPGAVGMMAKAIGVSVKQLNKMLEQGEVIAAESLPKMADAMIEFATANNALELAAKSNLAEQARMSNALLFFKNKIANSGFMDRMTEAFKEFANTLSTSDGFAQGLSDILVFLVDVIFTVIKVVKGLVSGFTKLNKISQAILLIFLAMNSKIAMWILLISILTPIIDSIADAISGWESEILVAISALLALRAILSLTSFLAFASTFGALTLATTAWAGALGMAAKAIAVVRAGMMLLAANPLVIVGLAALAVGAKLGTMLHESINSVGPESVAPTAGSSVDNSKVSKTEVTIEQTNNIETSESTDAVEEALAQAMVNAKEQET